MSKDDIIGLVGKTIMKNGEACTVEYYSDKPRIGLRNVLTGEKFNEPANSFAYDSFDEEKLIEIITELSNRINQVARERLEDAIHHSENIDKLIKIIHKKEE